MEDKGPCHGAGECSDPVVARLVAGDFRDCVVDEPVAVHGFTFDKPLNCEGAVFKADVTFEDCVFEGFVMFRGAQTPEHLTFRDCAFRDGASFAAGTSLATGVALEIETLRHVRLIGCDVDGYVTFNNRTFARSPNFSSTHFRQPPHFQGADFHSGTRFDGTIFDVPKNVEEAKRAVQAFRTLKIAAKTLGDSERFSEFTAAELQARLHSKSSDFLERLLIRLYGLTSDFGRSLLRPLLAVALSTVTISGVIGSFCKPKSWAAWGDAMLFCFQQVVNPFNVASIETAPGATNLVFQERQALMIVLGGLQSTAALTFLALFLFSLRRRFVQ